jgi:hypothetical protein
MLPWLHAAPIVASYVAAYGCCRAVSIPARQQLTCVSGAASSSSHCLLAAFLLGQGTPCSTCSSSSSSTQPIENLQMSKHVCSTAADIHADK